MIRQTLDARVLSLTIARPEKRNAITNAMYAELANALERAGHDVDVRCVLITGDGEVFTAGNDLADFAAVSAGTLRREDMHVHRFLTALATLEKPLVAAVPGLAVGVGVTLLLHCDLVFLAETATLSVPFVDLALVPEAASSLLLPARIGHQRSFALFALGEKLSAQSAVDLGLANQVVTSAELRRVATTAATRLAAKPPGALAATKRLMRNSGQLLEVMAAEGAEFQARLMSHEAREAFSAFAERRSPNFTGL